MSPEQPAELTTRDVLSQIDRRLELIEGDVRALNEKFDIKLDEKFVAIDTKLDTRIGGLDTKLGGLDTKLDNKISDLDMKLDTKIGGLDTKIGDLDMKLDTKIGGLDTKISDLDMKLDIKIDTRVGSLQNELNSKFRWILGLFIAGWISVLGAIIFKG